MFQKYASVEKILEVKSSAVRLPFVPGEQNGLSKFASLSEEYSPDDDYLYVRCRAISSRVNKNNDGWPSEELAASYRTFEGKPIFVDHNNNDPKRTRGVIVSSTLHVDDDKTSALDPYYSADVDKSHLPPTWIELVLEIDAKTYPKLATAVRNGDIDSVSMGANIQRSICSVCANEAESPSSYCSHIKQKGLTFEIESATGEKVKKKAYENCIGIGFFEISEVFDPADETALISEKIGHIVSTEMLNCTDCGGNIAENGVCDNCGKKFSSEIIKSAAMPAESLIEPFSGELQESDDRNYIPQDDMITAPQKVDTLRDETLCPNCHADHLQTDPDGIQKCPTCSYIQEPEPLNNPDLSTALDTDLRQQNQDIPNSEGDNEVPAVDNSDGVTISPANSLSSSYILSSSDRRINEMDWKVTLETTSKEMADRILPAKASTVETKIGFSDGIGFGTHLAFKEAGITAQVRYPVDGDNTNVLPGNPLKDFTLLKRAMTAIGTENPSEVIVKITSNDLERALELIQDGGLGKIAAQAKKKVLLPSSHKATSEPKDQKIVSDQLAPVTAKLLELKERLASLEVEADRRHIKREEREEDGGIVRSEEIIEESGEAEQPAYEEPAVQEPVVEEEAEEVPEEEEAGVAQASSENKLLTIFSLADDLVDMGIVSREAKMLFVAQLEKEDDKAIEGRIKMLASIKEAGVKKVTRLATNGINRVPRLAHHYEPSHNGNGSLDSIPDEAIFNS